MAKSATATTRIVTKINSSSRLLFIVVVAVIFKTSSKRGTKKIK